MTLANVVISDTFSTWLARTNQMVVLWNNLTDGTVSANNISANTITVTSWASVAGMNLVPTIQAAFAQANTGSGAFGTANSATTIATAAFAQANTANVRAYNDVLKTGDTMTGNLVMQASNIAFPTAATGLTFGPNSSILSPTPNVISFVTSGIETLNLSFFGNMTKMNTIIWFGQTSGSVNVRANTTTTNYQLTLPAAAGTANTPIIWKDGAGSLGSGLVTGTGQTYVLSASPAITGAMTAGSIAASGAITAPSFRSGSFTNASATSGVYYSVISAATIAANGDGMYLLWVGNLTNTAGGTYIANYNDGTLVMAALQTGTSSFLQIASGEIEGMQNQVGTGNVYVGWIFIPH